MLGTGRKNNSLRFTLMIGLILTACSPQRPSASTPQPDINTQMPTQISVETASATQAPVQVVTPALIPTQPLSVETPPSNPGPLSPTPPVVGIHVGNFNSDLELPLFENSGAVWTRFDDFHWNEIEPVLQLPAVYQWSAVDEAGLARAGQSGANIIGIVLFAPNWAQRAPGFFCGPFAETAFDRFGVFMEELVKRYSQPPYNVKYWEIGNEPDIALGLVPGDSGFGCWGEINDPYYGGRYYAQALQAAYPRVKAADPEAQVLVGGLLMDCDPRNPPESPPGSGTLKDCTPSRFLEGIIVNGGADFFDGVSFHAYDFYQGGLGKYGSQNWHSAWNTTGPVLINKTRYLRDLLRTYGYSDKFLVNTEVALICGQNGKEPHCQTDEFKLTKAYYMVHAHTSAMAEGLWANVWYSIPGWRGSTLIDAASQPNEAYQALRILTEKLNAAAYLAPVDLFPGVKGYAFRRDGEQVWVIWSADGLSHNVQLPLTPTAISDVFGGTLPVSQNLEIGLAPLYIEITP